MEKALNAQFNAELYSGYLYLAMAAYFEDNDYSGFAAWMRVQADEELEHGMKFYDYILRRGAKVNIEAIAKPETEWESPLAAFEQALSHERYVTSLINDLVALAREEKDLKKRKMQWKMFPNSLLQVNPKSFYSKSMKIWEPVPAVDPRNKCSVFYECD